MPEALIAAAIVAIAVVIFAIWHRKRKRENMGWGELMAEKIRRDAERMHRSRDFDFPLPPQYSKPRTNPFLIAPLALIPAVMIAVPPLPYYWIIVLAVLSAIWLCWLTWADIVQAKRNANMESGGYVAFTTLLLVIAVGVCFLAVQSGVYFAVIGLARLTRAI